MFHGMALINVPDGLQSKNMRQQHPQYGNIAAEWNGMGEKKRNTHRGKERETSSLFVIATIICGVESVTDGGRSIDEQRNGNGEKIY